MRKQTKRILSFVLTWILVLGMMPDMSLYVQAEPGEVEVAAWNLGAGVYSGYTVTKDGDENISVQLTSNIKTGATLGGIEELDLNGYGIRMTNGEAAIDVVGEFTLKDSNAGSNTPRVHYITVDDEGLGTAVSDTATGKCYEVTGGYITGSYKSKNSMSYSIAAVSVGGSFIMDGGTIIGNGKTDKSYGGGVYIDGGTFTMNGGRICHNRAQKGGAVYIQSNHSGIIMNGGNICMNNALFGGGVYIDMDSYGDIKGGIISGNNASRDGGGIYVNNNSLNQNNGLTMSGGTICQNSAGDKGGGIYLQPGGGKAKISGGTIKENKVVYDSGNNSGNRGGGIYAEDGLEVSGSPVIKDNYIDFGEGISHADNLYLPKTGGDQPESKKIKIGEGGLGEDAVIGVTLEMDPRMGNVDFIDGIGDYTDHIVYDNEEYTMEVDPETGETVLTNKPVPKILTAPEGKTLGYNGEDQELATSGSVNRGSMLYALGTDTVTVPADDKFTVNIPVGKNAGDYYVWYRMGDDHSKQGAVKSTITKKDMSSAKIKFAYDLAENGREQEQKIESVKLDVVSLEAGVDYTVDADSVLTAKDRGMYNVNITGKGNYYGSAHADWTMKPTENININEDKNSDNFDPMNPVPDIDLDLASQSIYLVKGQTFQNTGLAGWINTDKQSLSISKKGVVKAKKAGGLIMILSGDTSKTISVNICDPSIDKKLKLEAGESKKLDIYGKNENLTVRWFSSNQDVATVDVTGRVTAVAKGKTTVTLYINGKAYKCTVTVTEKKAAEKRTVHMNPGATKKLTLKGVKKAEWKAVGDGADKIQILKGGKIKAKKDCSPGTVSLNAVDPKDGKVYSATVYIEDITPKIDGLQNVKKNKYSLEMKVGQELLVYYAFADQDILFISNKGDVAHEDGYGLIRAKKAGTAKLTTKVNGKTVTITVNVTE